MAESEWHVLFTACRWGWSFFCDKLCNTTAVGSHYLLVCILYLGPSCHWSSKRFLYIQVWIHVHNQATLFAKYWPISFVYTHTHIHH
jgi:hypothetical protein